MMVNCPLCHWFDRYRHTVDLTPMERRALVDREVDHRRLHHGEKIVR